MEAKLSINLNDGVLEVEGSESFVARVYDDFKDRMAQRKIAIETANPVESKPTLNQSKKASKPKPKPKKTGADVEINPDLDVTGLKEFYDQFNPKKDSERALIFAIFLRDKRDLQPCSASDLHTCFFALKEQLKVPGNYNSLLINDSTRTKFFNRTSMDDISVTSIGENHFNHKLKKQGED